MPLPFTDRRVLLTGAGGSIGSALAREIVGHRPQSLLLLDHCEVNLHQLDLSLGSSPRSQACWLVLGDIADEALLAEIFEEHPPENILHVAAFKHVPLSSR
jgi:FlaA1/EpsC-like NDP-sugar epimerase